VAEVAGVRVVQGEGGLPRPEYLIRWADGAPPTWEPAARVADNLLRDWEADWWAACRKGDGAKVRAMLAGGGRVLACCVDGDRRSGLHFAAGAGSAECVALLIAAGANVDLRDKEGFTPLHLAVGYSHTPVVSLLLDAGADPEIRDAQGRDVVGLVASLRAATPPAPELLQRRVALEAAAAMLNGKREREGGKRSMRSLREGGRGGGGGGGSGRVEGELGGGGNTKASEQCVPSPPLPHPYPPSPPPPCPPPTDHLFEEVEPASILRARPTPAGSREFLVTWPDGRDDSWVPQSDLAQDVVDDFDAGLEYAPAASLLRERRRGDAREFLVAWADGRDDTWEPEEHVAADLVAEFDAAAKERARALAEKK
jgi:signal recognition particle protein